MSFTEPLPKVFSSSKLLILDPAKIDSDTPAEDNIEAVFTRYERKGINPRLPKYRQEFTDGFLDRHKVRYGVGGYGEDRSLMLTGTLIARQGRCIHLGLDAWSKDLEPLLAPCDGKIIRTGYEKQSFGYGHYLIFQPADKTIPYIFFGHLGSNLPALETVKAGAQISQLGDWQNNENGGWARHVHIQMLRQLPPEGQTPIGYSSKQDFPMNNKIFPDPMNYFSTWHFS